VQLFYALRLGILHTFTRDVILKLLAATLAMIVVPIGSYFLTVNTVFKGTCPLVRTHRIKVLVAMFVTSKQYSYILGNSTYAGGLAALMANVVLIGYVIVAMNEDQSDQIEAKKKEGKKEK
jgi:vacuolar ATPase assembly integral membrane protein VMA21